MTAILKFQMFKSELLEEQQVWNLELLCFPPFWNHVNHHGFFKKAISQLFEQLKCWNSKLKLFNSKYIILILNWTCLVWHFMLLKRVPKAPHKGLRAPLPSAGARRRGAEHTELLVYHSYIYRFFSGI